MKRISIGAGEHHPARAGRAGWSVDQGGISGSGSGLFSGRLPFVACLIGGKRSVGGQLV